MMGARWALPTWLIFVAGCYQFHGLGGAARDRDAAAGDAASLDTGGTPTDVETWCGFVDAQVVLPAGGGCVDQAVNTRGSRTCDSRGSMVEVVHEGGGEVSIEVRSVEPGPRLCVSAYPDCLCMDMACVASPSVISRAAQPAFQRLVIENEGRPVRVIVCRESP